MAMRLSFDHTCKLRFDLMTWDTLPEKENNALKLTVQDKHSDQELSISFYNVDLAFAEALCIATNGTRIHSTRKTQKETL